MRTLLSLTAAFLISCLPVQALACISCNRPLQQSIFNESFFTNMLMMLGPFSLAMAIGGAITYTVGKTGSIWSSTGEPPSGSGSQDRLTVRPLVGAALMLGIGMGGFVDGILFHQVLQWHQMLSNQVPPATLAAKNLNMFWDGIFHAFTWLVTFAGIIMLFRVAKRQDVVRSVSAFAGGMLIGWGLFNFAEGLTDHYILKLHNVRENTGDPEIYNLVFMILSFGLLAAGLLLVARSKKIAGLS